MGFPPLHHFDSRALLGEVLYASNDTKDRKKGQTLCGKVIWGPPLKGAYQSAAARWVSRIPVGEEVEKLDPSLYLLFPRNLTVYLEMSSK